MRALGFPAGDLRKPNLNMEGHDLGIGIQVVKDLGLAEKYQFTLPKEIISESNPPAFSSNSETANGPSKCFI